MMVFSHIDMIILKVHLVAYPGQIGWQGQSIAKYRLIALLEYIYLIQTRIIVKGFPGVSGNPLNF